MEILGSLALTGASFGTLALAGGLMWCSMKFLRLYRKHYR